MTPAQERMTGASSDRVQAVGGVPSPHLDVVQGDDLTGRGEAEDRFAAEPVDQVRVPGHRIGEDVGLGAEKARGLGLAPRG